MTVSENSIGSCSSSHSTSRAHASSWPSERRGPMRAYVTAAGMALGLVAVWAVLVPLVA
jgi:hypothetical protein